MSKAKFAEFITSQLFSSKFTLATGVIMSSLLMQNYQMDSKQEQIMQKLYAWGYGNFGQLGIGNEQTKHIPTEINSLDSVNIKHLAAKKSLSAIVTQDGKVYTWGKNKAKVLGIQSSNTNVSLPTEVTQIGDQKVVQLGLGPLHMVAVTENGEVYSWGNPENGKLGHSFDDGPKQTSKFHYHTRNHLESGGSAQKIDGLPAGTKIVRAACGNQHTVLLSDKGEVFTLGQNKKGILGYESEKVANKTPQKIQFFEGKKIVKISCGLDFTIAMSADGKLYGWGNNDYGQLGNGSNIFTHTPTQLLFGNTKIKNYSCGDYYAGAVSESGQVYTWGYGNDGQLCQRSREDIYTPQQIQFNHSVNKISCGSGHVAVITDSKTENGSLFMFGRGREGQLGLGDTITSEATYRTEPKKVIFFKNQKIVKVQAGGEHTMALVQNGQSNGKASAKSK